VATALTFTVGAALGVVAGMIFAPESGRQLRKRLSLQAKVLGRTSLKQINQAKILLSKQAGKLRTAAITAYEQAKKHVTNGHRSFPRRAVRHAVRHA
jgi:gas vesicle protein